MVPLSVRMRQHEPQAMTFTELLPVHVDPHINKCRKSENENERTRQPEKVWQNKTKQNEYDSYLLIKRA